MRVETANVEAFTIFDDDGKSKLDPILVILQDFGGGQGRIVLECWGAAWSAYWGAMGTDTTLRRFVTGTTVDYLVNRLLPTHMRTQRKRDAAYLKRVVEAVREAMVMNCTHPNIERAYALLSGPLSTAKKCPDCRKVVSKEM